MRFNYSIAIISPFRRDISLSSQSIQFDTNMSRAELDNKIQLQKILIPLCLSVNQYLGSREVLKIFVICNNINRKSQIFKIVAPNFKSFRNDQKFLVISVIIQLHSDKSLGVKDNQMNFILSIIERIAAKV